ncbi:hypothetical protein VSF3289_04494 [Vibrio scophthalmi]|uniref:Uncharacterized protein n=1 Tax=Vibrio scophthalmi TaxID=45658 RepID=A0A1E3WHT2_9VIBR|nr:hypothetical protein VSF3289_04494 [Vibrio scophthalmi]
MVGDARFYEGTILRKLNEDVTQKDAIDLFDYLNQRFSKSNAAMTSGKIVKTGKLFKA